MGNLVLDNKVLTTISTLAERLKTTKEDIVKKAVENYEKKLNKKNPLMSFAGILVEEEADNILSAIYNNRQNKDQENFL
jgi:DNA-binding protein Fis